MPRLSHDYNKTLQRAWFEIYQCRIMLRKRRKEEKITRKFRQLNFKSNIKLYLMKNFNSNYKEKITICKIQWKIKTKKSYCMYSITVINYIYIGNWMKFGFYLMNIITICIFVFTISCIEAVSIIFFFNWINYLELFLIIKYEFYFSLWSQITNFNNKCYCINQMVY